MLLIQLVWLNLESDCHVIILALVLIENAYALPGGQTIVRPPDIPRANRKYDSIAVHAHGVVSCLNEKL
jgi:hypothetical protein